MRHIHRLAILLIALGLPIGLRAHDSIALNGHRIALRSQSNPAIRTLTRTAAMAEGGRNALVQLAGRPTQAEIERLAWQGFLLGDYLGNGAYHAQLQGVAIRSARKLRGSITAIIPLRDEWKIDTALTATISATDVQGPAEIVDVAIYLAPNTPAADAHGALQAAGCLGIHLNLPLGTARASIPVRKLVHVAALPWVLRIAPADRPSSVDNHRGRTQGGGSTLATSATLGGRELTGRGIRIGVWDANIVSHPDLDGRFVRMESELSGDFPERHATHVLGSVIGSGVMNADGQGVAPQARAWTYNFNTQRNGKSEPQEMEEARRLYGITLTQNSYGPQLRTSCAYYQQFRYRHADYEIDRLAQLHPTLAHVFAAGNDRGSCQGQMQSQFGHPQYGTTTLRAKNVIYVGATDAQGVLAPFSSCGPQDDGRLFPTLVARGVGVLSTAPQGTYRTMDGTSMACPLVTGHLALLQERYRQLHRGGEIRSDLLRAVVANTADDAGRPGPDFEYGYGILNAERAVRALEQGQHTGGKLGHKESASHTIRIPSSTTGVRIMLAWNDAASSKDVAYGAPVLINDLDMQVLVDRTPYHPWVCQHLKGLVEGTATRRVDRLNNMEQVTISRAELRNAHEVTVRIEGHNVVDGQQTYALTWWFDEEGSQIIAPEAGASLCPGEKYVARMGGRSAWYDVWLSYDDGEHYVALGRIAGGGTPPGYSPTISIPADAPLSGKARLKMVDLQGRESVSAHPFTIAPQVGELQLTSQPCSRSGWELSWQAVDAAQHGYEVLAAEAHSGQFTSIGHTDGAQSNRFAIPGAIAQRYTRPVFSVAVRTPDRGWGKRSIGILAPEPQALRFTAATLPFVEAFAEIPSPHLRLELGEKMQRGYQSAPFTGIMGANQLMLRPLESTQGPEPGDYYDKSQNGAHIAEVRLCQVDLRSITPHEALQLRVAGRLSSVASQSKSTARFRVLVNGEPVADQLGTVDHMVGDERTDEFLYPMRGGQVVSIAIQFASRELGSTLTLSTIAIERIADRPDVALSALELPQEGRHLKHIEGTVRLRNNNALPIRGVRLQSLVDGQWQWGKTIDILQAKEERRITIPIDLSEAPALGALRRVQIRAIAVGDVDAKNNTIGATVNNFGDVLTMPRSHSEMVNGKRVTHNPRRVHVVEGPTMFSDDGGVHGLHSGGQESTLKLAPKDPTMRVRVQFSRFRSYPIQGTLAVYTTDVGDDLSLSGIAPRVTLSGRHHPMPATYVSEAADGAVTLHFRSNLSTDEGWIAAVDVVPRRNPLAVVEAKAQRRGTAAQGDVTVEATVLNRWPEDAKEVTLVLWDGYRAALKQWIKQVPSGRQHIVFDKKLRMPLGSNRQYTLLLQGEDYDDRDNQLPVLAAYDRYCLPGLIANVGMRAIRQVELDGKSLPLPAPAGNMQYHLRQPLALYRSKGASEMAVHLAQPAQAGQALGVWVDWNDDGEFSPNEGSVQSISPNAGVASVELNPMHIQGTGVRRMRIAVGSEGELAAGPCFGQGLTAGDIRDVSIAIEEAPAHEPDDLALVQVSAGPDGRELASDQSITIRIRNASDRAYRGRIRVITSVDGKPLPEETIDCESSPIAPGGEGATYQLQGRADVSAKGRHRIEVRIDEADAKANKGNNSQSVDVHCLRAEADGFYALHMQSLRDGQQRINLRQAASRIPRAKQGEAYTVELLMMLDRAQGATVMESSGFKLYTQAGGSAASSPCKLTLDVGNQRSLSTKKDVLEPGRWHHVAVVMRDITPSSSGVPSTTGRSQITLYVDGVRCELASHEGGEPQLEGLQLGTRLDGKVDEFRVWHRAVDEDEIRTHMHAHWRNAAGELPAGSLMEFSFDEGPGNSIGMSGDEIAYIEAESDGALQAADGGIWYDSRELISSIRLQGQVGDAVRGEGSVYTVRFPKGTDPGRVEGDVQATWPGSQLIYHGKPVGPGNPFDFNSEVRIAASHTAIFGKELQQEVELRFALIPLEGCDLLTLRLEQANNPWLTGGDLALAIQPKMVATLPTTPVSEEQAKSVVLTFQVSEDAVLLYGESEHRDGQLTVNLREPIRLTVRAASGATKQYHLRMAAQQQLEWPLDEVDFVYGDEGRKVRAVSQSGLSITFASSKPAVASVANDTLRVGQCGTCEVTARQMGGGFYGPSNSVTHTITVRKRAVRMRPAMQPTPFGEAVKWQFAYETLVAASDAHDLPDPMAMGVYKLHDAKGAEVDPQSLLGVGTYTLRVAKSEPYESAQYIITPEEGTFVVEQGSKRLATLTVVDQQGGPIERATVRIGTHRLHSDARGEVSLPLESGQKYDYTAEHPGYMAAQGQLEVASDENTTLRIVLRSTTITLEYEAESHGQIAGEGTQHIAPGSDGAPVLAQADAGYHFTRWDDDVAANPRTDRGVSQPLRAKALFAADLHTARYTVQAGGEWVSGPRTQRIPHGENGESVEVRAQSDDRFFAAWSDGKRLPRRQDVNVQQDVSATAIFGRYAALPEAQHFAAELEAIGWYTITQGAQAQTWRVHPVLPEAGSPIAGPFAVCQSKTEAGSNQGSQSTSGLYTARYRLAGVGSGIEMQCDYLFKRAGTETLALEYTVDGESWIPLGNAIVAGHQGVKTLTQTVDRAAISGAAFIQFRWVYQTHGGGGYVALGRVHIYESGNAQHRLTYQAEPAEGGKFIIGGNEASSQVVAHGQWPQDVHAVAEPGYRFGEWIGHKGGPILRLHDPTLADARYTARFLPQELLRVQYIAQAEEGGHFEIAGERITEQLVRSGEHARTVTAVAHPGYHFTRWGDNGDANPVREEGPIHSDATIEGLFERNSHTLVVEVVRHNAPVEGVGVSMGTIQRTGSDGRARFTLSPGQYTYSISDAQHTIHRGEIAVQDEDTYLRIDLGDGSSQPLRQIAFRVTSNGVPLPGTSITLNGQQQATDERGEAHWLLPDGTYPYTVSHMGYDAQSGAVKLNGRNATVEVAMEVVRYQLLYRVPLQARLRVVDANGKHVPNGNLVDHGTQLTMSAETDEGYRIAALRVNGTDRLAELMRDGAVQLRILEATSIEVEVGRQTGFFPVTIVPAQHGTIAVTLDGIPVVDGDLLPLGRVIKIALTPESGYRLAMVTVNGNDRSELVTGGVLEYQIAGSSEIAAEFRKTDTDVPSSSARDGADGVHVAPNPFTHTLAVHGLQSGAHIRVINAQGSVVHEEGTQGRQRVELSLGHLPAGLYLVVIVGDGKRRCIPVVKR